MLWYRQIFYPFIQILILPFWLAFGLFEDLSVCFKYSFLELLPNYVYIHSTGFNLRYVLKTYYFCILFNAKLIRILFCEFLHDKYSVSRYLVGLASFYYDSISPHLYTDCAFSLHTVTPLGCHIYVCCRTFYFDFQFKMGNMKHVFRIQNTCKIGK